MALLVFPKACGGGGLKRVAKTRVAPALMVGEGNLPFPLCPQRRFLCAAPTGFVVLKFFRVTEAVRIMRESIADRADFFLSLGLGLPPRPEQ
jgi:hypothetical protein